MTLPAIVADVDWGMSDHGMVYVALSRVRRAQDLHLAGFDPAAIRCHRAVRVAFEKLRVSGCRFPGDDEPPELPPFAQLPAEVKARQDWLSKNWQMRNLIHQARTTASNQIRRIGDSLNDSINSDGGPTRKRPRLAPENVKIPNFSNKGSESYANSVLHCFLQLDWFRGRLAVFTVQAESSSSPVEQARGRLLRSLLDLFTLLPGETGCSAEIRERLADFHRTVCNSSNSQCGQCAEVEQFRGAVECDPATFMVSLISAFPPRLRSAFIVQTVKTSRLFSCIFCFSSYFYCCMVLIKKVVNAFFTVIVSG